MSPAGQQLRNEHHDLPPRFRQAGMSLWQLGRFRQTFPFFAPSAFPETQIKLFFLALLLATWFTFVLDVHAQMAWLISDWLINYQGGFVRRGLPGEAVYTVAHLLNLSPIGLAVALLLCLATAFLCATCYLAVHGRPNLWLAALILSPATFTFHLQHPLLGLRKEIIFLAGLALFLALVRKNRLSAPKTALYLSAVAALTVFSHEALGCYIPYLFAAVVVSGYTISTRGAHLPCAGTHHGPGILGKCPPSWKCPPGHAHVRELGIRLPRPRLGCLCRRSHSVPDQDTRLRRSQKSRFHRKSPLRAAISPFIGTRAYAVTSGDKSCCIPRESSLSAHGLGRVSRIVWGVPSPLRVHRRLGTLGLHPRDQSDSFLSL